VTSLEIFAAVPDCDIRRALNASRARVKAYDYRNGAHRLQAAEAGAQLYRLHRTAADAVWPPKERAYGGEAENLRRRLKGPLQMAGQLLLPVIILTTLLGAAYLYTDDFLLLPRAPRLIQNAWLAMSDLVLPLAFYSIHLTNRRFGAGHAFAQLLAGLAILGLVALINPGDIDNWINNTPVLTWRAMLAFGAAFLFANFIAIIFFDAARGPRWWAAPLAASFAAALAFSAVYYPATFAGTEDVSWTDCALVHFGVFFGESLLLLLPYYLLRPAMRPMPGMNGY
jgi:queuosine precursor transporter